MIKHINQSEFEEQVKEGTVIIDFYADWCGPCKMLSPVLEELSEEMGDKVKFLKVNVDGNTQLAVGQGVTNIPALVIFKAGEKQDMLVGFKPKESIKEELEKYL